MVGMKSGPSPTALRGAPPPRRRNSPRYTLPDANRTGLSKRCCRARPHVDQRVPQDCRYLRQPACRKPRVNGWKNLCGRMPQGQPIPAACLREETDNKLRCPVPINAISAISVIWAMDLTFYTDASGKQQMVPGLWTMVHTCSLVCTCWRASAVGRCWVICAWPLAGTASHAAYARLTNSSLPAGPSSPAAIGTRRIHAVLQPCAPTPELRWSDDCAEV